MANLYLIQFVGVMLVTAGLITLIASTHVFGIPRSPAEKQRASDEWNRRKSAYRLPMNLETIVSALFFLGGIVILIESRFSPCAFLIHWFPTLPEIVRLFLSCT